jgi:hypothetical protein
MDRPLVRIAVPALPFAVLLLILLLVDDPKKPWSGVAYVAACLMIVGLGWAVGRWIIVAIPAAMFAVAVFFSEREPDPGEGVCDPACWSGGDGLLLLAFVLGALLAIGVVLRRLVARVSAKRA